MKDEKIRKRVECSEQNMQMQGQSNNGQMQNTSYCPCCMGTNCPVVGGCEYNPCAMTHMSPNCMQGGYMQNPWMQNGCMQSQPVYMPSYMNDIHMQNPNMWGIQNQWANQYPISQYPINMNSSYGPNCIPNNLGRY